MNNTDCLGTMMCWKQEMGLGGCSQQKWLKEGQALNQQRSHGHPRFTDVHEKQRVARVVWSHRIATIEQAENFNTCYDQQLAEQTVHNSLLCMGLCSCRPVHHSEAHKGSIWVSELDYGAMVWSDESCFLLHYVQNWCMGKTWHHEQKTVEAGWCSGQCSAWKPWPPNSPHPSLLMHLCKLFWWQRVTYTII